MLAERYLFLRGLDMPLNSNIKQCTHIKVNGIRCGSPSLRGEQFCYFHQRMLRSVPVPPDARLHPVALIENEEAIQASLMEVVNAIVRNTIDLRRADLILKAIHIAVKNSRRVRFDINNAAMVQQVPDYPARPKPPAHVESRATVETKALAGIAHVGTAALGCPGGPEAPGRGDPFTKPNAAIDPTQRKPPARAAEARKERKTAAHSLP
jgi:hypothetical protein